MAPGKEAKNCFWGVPSTACSQIMKEKAEIPIYFKVDKHLCTPHTAPFSSTEHSMCFHTIRLLWIPSEKKMFVVCTEKEQIIPTLHLANPALTSGADRPITRWLPGGEEPPALPERETPSSRRQGWGEPCGVTRALSERCAGRSSLQPHHGRSRRACQSEPSAQPPPSLPTAQGGGTERGYHRRSRSTV